MFDAMTDPTWNIAAMSAMFGSGPITILLLFQFFSAAIFIWVGVWSCGLWTFQDQADIG